MKKKIISALMAALVVGVASPTFAAEIDDQVKELRDRVTELERDSQYNRNRVAELERDSQYNRNRVAELEDELADRNSSGNWTDKFDVKGELRFRFWNLKEIADRTRLEMRIMPTMQITDNLALKSRFTGSYENMNDDASSSWAMNYAYLEGNFDQFYVSAGKVPLLTKADSNPNSGSMIFDDYFSGVQVGTTNGNFDFNINLGRTKATRGAMDNLLSLLDDYYTKTQRDVILEALGTSTYVGGEAVYKSDDEKFNVGAGYHYLKTNGAKSNVLALGGGYQLTDDVAVYGAYAHNSKAGDKKNAYNIEGTYLGAKRDEPGTWGAYVAYRYVPIGVGPAPSYDTFKLPHKKGFEFGGTWTPVENTLIKASYFHGKSFIDNINDRTFFARASFFF